jgi:hypothetical protein
LREQYEDSIKQKGGSLKGINNVDKQEEVTKRNKKKSQINKN